MAKYQTQGVHKPKLPSHPQLPKVSVGPAILAKSKSEEKKRSEIGGQDISAHWQVTSSAFLGGITNVKMFHGRRLLEAIFIELFNAS